jgi:signal peptidase I
LNQPTWYLPWFAVCGKIHSRDHGTEPKLNVRRLVVAAGLVVAATEVVRRYRPIHRFEIAESSMAPALRPGDYVITARPGPPRRGAVVVYEHPERRGLFLTKRIVALPGERVTVGDGWVEIDGRPGIDRWARQPTEPDGAWTVESGHVFVLGDNRQWSAGDSRRVGTLAVTVLDRVILRYWPPARVGLVGRA